MKFTIRHHFVFALLITGVLVASSACSKGGKETVTPTPPPDTTAGATPANPLDVSFWLTTGNGSALLQKQTTSTSPTTNTFSTITVDSTQQYQTIDGFGYTVTGGSAYVINHNLNAADRSALIKELFGTDSSGIGVSYLRIGIGATDLDRSVFSYDDVPAGQTDTMLAKFSLANDSTDLIPLLKDIISVNPSVKIIATPWSAPVWMKSNNSTKGGSLLPAYYTAYANYFVKYILAMKAQGITIDAVTPQNEPMNPDNNPSLVMTAGEQASFIKSALGPAFQSAGITAKIITWDHNCDMPQYPEAVLGDADANKYIDGSAFHLYAGDISALSTVHNAYPDKNIYFTEQYTASTGDFGGDLKWHLKNVIIGSMRNWSRTALEWNLANDASFGPHTDGGCTTCKGALTIGSSVTRNVAYYIIAHASKFVIPGSKRIASSSISNLNNVVFVRPDGKKVLIAENDGDASVSFNIASGNKKATVTLSGGAVGTFVW